MGFEAGGEGSEAMARCIAFVNKLPLLLSMLLWSFVLLAVLLACDLSEEGDEDVMEVALGEESREGYWFCRCPPLLIDSIVSASSHCSLMPTGPVWGLPKYWGWPFILCAIALGIVVALSFRSLLFFLLLPLA
jgi:hypothetical protein